MSSTSVTLTSATMNNCLTIRAVREGRMGKTVILCLTDGENAEKLTLSREEYAAIGSPAVGEMPDDATLAEARRLAERRASLATALHILECGDTSRARLYEKLLARGYSAEAAEAAVAVVIRHGYIDESRLAARQVVLCVKKGWGRRRILAYLTSRGVPAETVSEAMASCEASGEIDFAEARRLFIETRRAKGMDDDAIKRALWRAGF